MSGIKEVKTCPLGSVCEEVKDGAIHRCRWYVEVVGKDPTSDQILHEKDCAMAWVPTLLIEGSRTNRGQTKALEDFRNAVIGASQQRQLNN